MWKHTHTNVNIEASFVTAKYWTQSKCPEIEDWLEKRDTVMWYSTIQLKMSKKELCQLMGNDFRNALERGKSKMQKIIYGRISFLWERRGTKLYMYLLFLAESVPSPISFSIPPLRSSQSTGLSSLCFIANLHLLSILYMVVCMLPCSSLNSSHPLLPLLCPQSVLYVCISTAALQTGSSDSWWCMAETNIIL